MGPRAGCGRLWNLARLNLRLTGMSIPVARSSTRSTPLRPATYAGLAAAIVSIAAMIVIRVAPAAESVATILHLLVNVLLFATAGALAARLGGAGWRAGLFAGLLDAIVGHTIAFLISQPPDASKVTVPLGTAVTPQMIAMLHLWGAVSGALVAVLIAIAAGAAGGWYAGRRRAARRR